MIFSEITKVKDKIESDINDIKRFDEVEHFVSATFRQFLTGGEYDDNSIDMAYFYNMLKEIEKDDRFMAKLHFVLNQYVYDTTYCRK